jgi:hypothetical protein
MQKYVDLAYARDNEEPKPWMFKNLAEDNNLQFYKAMVRRSKPVKLTSPV